MSEHATEEVHHGAHAAHIAEEHHPQAATYLIIAVILTVLTLMEIGVFYAPPLQSVLVPVLVVLAIAKFILVGGCYMHLYYDNKVFTVLFFFPLLLAALICTSLLMLFAYLIRHPG
jgi:heme/copper-type cytochrome/quinol oxidase subunit 4